MDQNSPRLMVESQSLRLEKNSQQLTEQILNRIAVQPPYFALKQLTLENDTLSASAKAELPTFYEQSPMAAGELGRHAAILGSSHAALKLSDERRFFLAKQAECRYKPSNMPFESPVRFSSNIIELSKRALKVHVEAECGNEAIAAFDLSYTILPQATFKRLFSARAQATPRQLSPYTKLLTTNYKKLDNALEQVIKNVPIVACAGHFPSYPALPVAVIMGQLSYLAGQLCKQPYRVVAGSVKAKDLSWAGQNIRFHVERQSQTGLEQVFFCQAFADEKSVAEMTLTFELIA